jgi:NAD(P)-dependent dehydrogenase (short-subunit alcohol dehydrogenase family)
MAVSIDLSGQVAVVTGGATGLGFASATALRAAGAEVIIAGRREDLLRTAAERLGARAISCDVTDTASIDSLFEAVEAAHGRLDILVNAAGMNRRDPALDVKPEDWDAVIAVNARGTFFCCQAAGRLMQKAGRGRIVNIGSMGSEIGIVNASAYAAAKGAVKLATMTMAAEWARYGICVNAVLPGWFKTELTEKLFEDEAWRDRVLARIPQGRAGAPSEIGNMVLFLCSPLADYVTGEAIRVDGGALAW